MATIRERDIEIDPRFPVPPGVIDVRQEYSEDASSSYDEELIADAPTLDDPNSTLPVPISFNIVSQTIRIAPDGTSVVDVIIEFPDNGLVSDLEMQVTKL